MNDLYFGYCDIVITPPDTIGLAGFGDRMARGFNNSGVHDDLYAQAYA